MGEREPFSHFCIATVAFTGPSSTSSRAKQAAIPELLMKVLLGGHIRATSAPVSWIKEVTTVASTRQRKSVLILKLQLICKCIKSLEHCYGFLAVCDHTPRPNYKSKSVLGKSKSKSYLGFQYWASLKSDLD